MTSLAELTDTLDRALPQTQCTRCGYPDCRSYAAAIADGSADINQCPPGGAEGVARLARLTGRPAAPLNPANGTEGPRLLAVIDEAWCIGCTLCIKACPVDSIVGAPKRMHTVVDDLCTGVPADRRFHYDVIGAGHYGIFSGRRWREKVYPKMRDFIAAHQDSTNGTAKKRPAARAKRRAVSA